MVNTPTTSTTSVAGLSAGTYRWGVLGACLSSTNYSNMAMGQNFTIGTTNPAMMAAPAEVQIQAWPNPVEDYLLVRLPKSTKGESSIRMFDAQGRLVADSASATENDDVFMIDVQQMPYGLYHLVVYANNQQTTRSIAIVR